MTHSVPNLSQIVLQKGKKKMLFFNIGTFDFYETITEAMMVFLAGYILICL